MEISNYADLLKAAHMQPELQRLLFVFTAAELPEGHTAEEKDIFHAQSGGTLTPIMCVDKLPHEVMNFADLEAESRQMGKSWDIVFVAGMSGTYSAAPTSKDADKPLQTMIESIKSGNIKNYLTFNRQGDLVQIK